MSDISWPEGEAPSDLMARARAHMVTDAVRYSDILHVRCQPAMTAMVAMAAQGQGTQPAAGIFARPSWSDCARMVSISPLPMPAHWRQAGRRGALCARFERAGRCGDQAGAKPDLADSSFHPAGYVPRDGDAWLPIYHVDSEPFDAAIHWRLPYVTRVEADKESFANFRLSRNRWSACNADGFPDLGRTAATNQSADSSINWAEGQAPSSVNDSARAMMASLREWGDDISGAIVTGGTSTSYTVTSYSTFTSLPLMGQAGDRIHSARDQRCDGDAERGRVGSKASPLCSLS